MGQTIRKEIWFQGMTGQLAVSEPTDDMDHCQRQRAQALLDRLVPNHRELVKNARPEGQVTVGDQPNLDHQLQKEQQQPQSPTPPPPIPTPSLLPAPSLPPRTTSHPGKANHSSTQLRKRSSLAPSRFTLSDSAFATQSSPTKRKHVRLFDSGKERVPGIGSDSLSPQARRADGDEAGEGRWDKRRRVEMERGDEVEFGVAEAERGGSPEKASGASASDATQLSQGSIARCIPHPFRHLDTIRPGTLDPPTFGARQIDFSYHDPDIPSARLLSTPGASAATQSSRSDAFLFPNLLPSLAPGRRGAWLIPLSGPLPWTLGRPTPPSWEIGPGKPVAQRSAILSPARAPRAAPSSSATLLSPGRPPTSSGLSLLNPRSPRRIGWTDTRLRALWHWLDLLHASSQVGPVWAECLTSRQCGGLAPDHIRVHGLAHLALKLRHMLALMDVKNTKWEGEKDDLRFLDQVRLVWVDEGGRPTMVA